jgi:hypothetical protein
MVRRPVLNSRMGEQTTCQPGNCQSSWWRVAAMRDSTVKQILPELGKIENITGEEAKPHAGLGATLPLRRPRRHSRETGATGVSKDPEIGTSVVNSWSNWDRLTVREIRGNLLGSLGPPAWTPTRHCAILAGASRFFLWFHASDHARSV